MFTLDQIIAAHQEVKSAADFPFLMQNLFNIGVKSFETFVANGQTIYTGVAGFQLKTAPLYEALLVNQTTDSQLFMSKLKDHQQQKTDFPTFCSDCAKTGIAKWEVCLEQWTCTYFDSQGHNVLIENIPN